MENALVTVFTGELIEHTHQYCNARDLHSALQVGRVFATWITRRIEEYGFVEGEDFQVIDFPILGNQKKGRGGDRRSIDYHLTLDMAKELAMIENNEIGRAVRRYFIRAEAELRERMMADLRDRARHVLTLPGVKPLRDGISFKQTVVLQEQSRMLMRELLAEGAAPARVNLHRQLRQVNDALGIPTDPLETIEAALAVVEG